MVKKSKYFTIGEFFPPNMVLAYSENLLWSLLDERLVWTADRLRQRYGRAYINNWEFGGENQYRGFRPFDSKIGAEWSQHKFGRAIDITFETWPADAVRENIRAQGMDFYDYKFITAVEEKVPWLHADCRFTNLNHIRFFQP